MVKERFAVVPVAERVSGAWVWIGEIVEETGRGADRLLPSFASAGVRVGTIPFPGSGVPGLYVERAGYNRWKSLAEWRSVTIRRVARLPEERQKDG